MPTNTIAIAFPLEIDSATGSYLVYDLSQLNDVVEQNIKMVLLTNPGEKLFNNSFGVGLYRYLFMHAHEIINGVPGSTEFPPLRQFILSQLQTYIPYITVEDLTISNSQNLLNVNFKYYINNTEAAFEFDLTINDVSL